MGTGMGTEGQLPFTEMVSVEPRDRMDDRGRRSRVYGHASGDRMGQVNGWHNNPFVAAQFGRRLFTGGQDGAAVTTRTRGQKQIDSFPVPMAQLNIIVADAFDHYRVYRSSPHLG
jgi:hypothetical protein